MEDYLSINEIKKREKEAIQKGVTVEKMMDKAGYETAKFIDKTIKFNKALFIAGTGNNGGDALSAAFHLFNLKHGDIKVFVIGREDSIKEEPATFLKLIKDLGEVPLYFLQEESQLNTFKSVVQDSDLLVVGIFGTGFHGELNPFYSAIIDIINDSSAKKVSIDIPSGMNGDTGEFEKAVKSDYTVTMQYMKKAFKKRKR